MVETRVVYVEPGKITLDTMVLPDLGPNDVLIKVHQASVCGSERYYYRGISVRAEDEAKGGHEVQLGAGRLDGKPKHAYPMGPLGHEGGGTIVMMGPGVEMYVGGGQVSIGDRVGSLIYPTYTDAWVTSIQHVQPIPVQDPVHEFQNQLLALAQRRVFGIKHLKIRSCRCQSGGS